MGPFLQTVVIGSYKIYLESRSIHFFFREPRFRDEQKAATKIIRCNVPVLASHQIQSPMAFKHSMVFLQNKSQCPLFPSKANHRLQIVLFPPKAIYQLPSSKCGSSELSGYITDTQPYLHGHGIATYWGKKTMVIPMKVTSTYHFHPCSCEKEKNTNTFHFPPSSHVFFSHGFSIISPRYQPPSFPKPPRLERSTAGSQGRGLP